MTYHVTSVEKESDHGVSGRKIVREGREVQREMVSEVRWEMVSTERDGGVRRKMLGHM